MNRRTLLAAALLILPLPFVAAPATAGCFLGVADASRLNICLNTPNLTDAENFSLATLGEKLWPGDPNAIAVARAWKSAFANDLLGTNGGAAALGGPTDIATWHITRQANYSGGTPGFVNSAFRADTQVGVDVKAFEWSVTGFIESWSNWCAAVGVYGKAIGHGLGTVWGGVSEAFSTGNGSAVGHEIDVGKAAGSTGLAIGLDIVDTGYMDAAIRVQEGRRMLVDMDNANTYIAFTPGGGIQFVVNGRVAQAW
ncbi:MAG: hypothetical protein JWO51_122 [Rhodospirillales bacterium]|nr:hypothetical protein [Rhodospirillales bacterium]